MRSRELWLWLGGSLLAIGTALATIALAYFTKLTHFSLYASWQFISAAAASVLALVCFLGAIMGWSFRLTKARFPNIKVDISQISTLDMPQIFKPVDDAVMYIWLMRLVITNNEEEQPISIRTAFLFGVATTGRFAISQLPNSFTSNIAAQSSLKRVDLLRFPINVAPKTGVSGDILFVQQNQNPPPMGLESAQIAIEDAASGKLIKFPASVGAHYRGHGFLPCVRAEFADANTD
jgi:hypothetical protein